MDNKIEKLNIIACSMPALFVLITMYYSHIYTQEVLMTSVSSTTLSSIQVQVAVYGLLFFGFFVYNFIINMKKVPTKTAKTISIIGLCLTGIMILIHLLSVTGRFFFWELSTTFIVYACLMLIFNYVLLRQSAIVESWQ